MVGENVGEEPRVRHSTIAQAPKEDRPQETVCRRPHRLSRMVERHKTALGRTQLSRPIQLALASGLIHEDVALLDYGCGRGDDIRILSGLGHDCVGWDLAHRPDGDLRPSEIVNLGYVVNVIEDPRERMETLRSAWNLASRVLIVAARVDFQAQPENSEELADGVITGRGTFQKFYTQSELRDWIDHTLDVLSVAAGPGIFFVFDFEVTECPIVPPEAGLS